MLILQIFIGCYLAILVGAVTINPLCDWVEDKWRRK